MNGKEGHIESHWNDDQAEDPSQEMFEPKPKCDGLGISEQNPQLDNSQTSNPGYREQADPFHADGSTKSEASGDEPEPPTGIKGFGRPLLMLICKTRES